jgi:hypothetical protein
MAAYTTIDNPELYFQVKLYTGTGSELAVTLDGDENMQPDFVWSKNREQSEGHKIFDSVRGVTKFIMSNNTDAEATAAQTLKSFDSDGVTIGTDADMNTSSEKNVLWCWKESATAGFDIVGYTGNGSARTISHSLSAVPSMMIVKIRNDTGYNWIVYHHKNTSAPETDYLYLNTTAATADATVWNDTAPTSSVFSVGTSGGTNQDTSTFINYLWSEVQGFSKFGSYIGNNGGTSNGVFVYTGFRPKLVIQKLSSSSGANWIMRDTARDTYNPMDNQLEANTSDAKEDNHAIDFLSNGFKTRANGLNQQDSGETYIYMAFAEAPFVNSNGVPCNAR